MRYLMTMEPLEPYTFGTEHSFKYDGEKATGRESYFVTSAEMPEQTTVFGMLRYILLKDRGKLKNDFKYTEEEKGNMKELIGENSFSFTGNAQNFGIIDSVSPVFIINSEGQKLIRCPFCMKRDGKLMKMDKSFCTSFGEIHLPKENEYVAKKGYIHDFYNLDTGKIDSQENDKPLFLKKMMTGNNKNDKDGMLKVKKDHDEGFFKTEKVFLRKGCRFACYVELKEELNEKCFIGKMGRGRSTFKVYFAEEKSDEGIDDMVSAADWKSDGAWYYCLSDVFLTENVQYRDFAIVETKETRNLETRLSEKGIRRFKKSDKLFKLIAQGSVFFVDGNEEIPVPENVDAEKIGYNHIIKIGGNMK